MPMNPKAPHGGDGKLVQTIESIETDAKACRLRSKGYTYQQIADELGESGAPAVYRRVQRAISRVIQEPAEEVRTFELDRLDRMWREVEAILEAEHIVVQHGKVVYTNTGEPLPDHDSKMRAVASLLKIQERRAKLLGLDAATKTQVSGGVKYEIVGVDISKLT